MGKNEVSKVVGVLAYGSFEGASRKKILGIFALWLIFSFAMIALGFSLIIKDQIENSGEILSFVFSLIAIFLGLLFLPIVFLCMIVKNERMRKRVQLWLDDAVAVDAYAREADRKYQFGILYVKLQVDFEINGLRYTRYSESRGDKTVKDGGYYLFWRKYVNKEIKVLYSKKYDQVMILKNN